MDIWPQAFKSENEDKRNFVPWKMRQVTWWQLTGRRLRYSTFFLSQFLLAIALPTPLETLNFKAGGMKSSRSGWTGLWAHRAVPTPFSSMPALLLSKLLSFWSMTNSSGCVPFLCLCYPQSPDWDREKALVLCKHFSAIAKTLVWCQCYFRHKSKKHHHMGCWGENQLHPSQSQYNIQFVQKFSVTSYTED